jgi:hypothetical protein
LKLKNNTKEEEGKKKMLNCNICMCESISDNYDTMSYSKQLKLIELFANDCLRQSKRKLFEKGIILLIFENLRINENEKKYNKHLKRFRRHRFYWLIFECYLICCFILLFSVIIATVVLIYNWKTL